MDEPSRILAQAREHLEALKQSGLSREALLALLEEESQPQPQSQPQSHHQQHHHAVAETSAVPNFSYRDINTPFDPPPQYRSSVSSTASSSSRDSYFSSSSARSSVSSTTGPTTEAKFWCTSCDKTFKRKFDWKRHEEEFHERSKKYPCPNCNQSFWGSNTFNQHHKSAHGCKTCPHADSVVKEMRKRKAWGCGFCAAMHPKFERHIDHVSGHFEKGSTKTDWLHSNVIYGLLHQHGIHEAWKALVAKKESQFNGRQLMFSWSPESTGRAQGFVENENPGQLQDLLEFFDGSKEAAEEIVQMADTCVHVVLRPKSSPMPPGATLQRSPTSPSNSHKHISVLPPKSRDSRREPKRSASTSSIPRTRRPSTQTIPADSQPPVPVHSTVPTMMVSPSTRSANNIYDAFPQPPSQPQTQPSYADKELPPAPLDSVSPMEVDFPIFNGPSQGFLPVPDMTDDWSSFTSTLIDETPMEARGFPMSWDDLSQFRGNVGN